MLNGIGENTAGVYAWISDHFFDPDIALLFIEMEPLDKNFDPNLFLLACFLSNILIWNMDETKYNGLQDMLQVFKFIAIANENIEGNFLEWPTLLCVSHESEKQGYVSNRGAEFALGKNNDALESFLKKHESGQTQDNKIKDTIKNCFASRNYFRSNILSTS